MQVKDYLYITNKSIPLYRGELIIIFSNSVDKVKKTFPDFDGSYVYAHSLLANFKSVQGFYVILNFHSKYREMTHGSITHESIHIADYIAEQRGFIADFNNDEPIAYLAEWITDEIYIFIKKHKMCKLIL